MFAQQKLTLPKSRHKIIILDEADRYISAVLIYNVFRMLFQVVLHILREVVDSSPGKTRYFLATFTEYVKLVLFYDDI